MVVLHKKITSLMSSDFLLVMDCIRIRKQKKISCQGAMVESLCNMDIMDYNGIV